MEDCWGNLEPNYTLSAYPISQGSFEDKMENYKSQFGSPFGCKGMNGLNKDK